MNPPLSERTLACPGNRAYGRRCYGSGSELAKDGLRKKGPAALTDAMTNAGSLGLRSTAGRNTNG